MSPRCTVCDTPTRLLFEQDGLPISGCNSCGHRQCTLPVGAQHLAREYGDKYFNGGGAGYRNYLSESELLVAHGKRYAKLMAKYCEPAHVLDVGCAAGFISKAFTEAGWKVTGIDPNPTMVAHARGELGLGAHPGSLEHVESIVGFEAPKGGFDLVLMIQVVAHFFDLDEALAKASRLIRPGGLCLVETWDCSSLTARLLGQRWHEYSPPSVLHYFSRKSLGLLMERHGFRAVATGRPAKRVRLDHAASLLRYKYGRNAIGSAICSLVERLPDLMELPYPSEDLFWALFERRSEPSARSDSTTVAL